MTEKRFSKFELTQLDDATIDYGVKDSITGKWHRTVNNQTARELTDLLNEQDRKIKELENTIKKLVIKLFEPPCIDNEDNDYEVLRKYLNEEYNINCTQIDIDVQNEKMLLKIEDETMPDNETDFKKKLEEIIGDSTGLEAAKKVADYYRNIS